ncbi:MAG TPA: carboxymuconolactone decarboxylase family protein [Thermoanaerobaculia bacterium]|nr:carboxymuconolactone decarboxylase family protein [Thermoanaerobaculia bacterium]
MTRDVEDLEEFRAYRLRMNEKIMSAEHLGLKRFFNLDTAAYRDGALDKRTKELLGLVASTVLRCNDCMDYHLNKCVEAGWGDEELHDVLNVALVVGGTVVIPHLRHAFETLQLLRDEKRGNANPFKAKKGKR